MKTAIDSFSNDLVARTVIFYRVVINWPLIKIKLRIERFLNKERWEFELPLSRYLQLFKKL